MTDDTHLIQEASDPATDPARLAELAYEHPATRAAVAAHPAAYPGLLEWLGALGDPALDAVLAAREATAAPAARPAVEGAPADPVPTPRAPRPRRIALIATIAGVVVAALVAGGAYALTRTSASSGEASGSGAPASRISAATDYRFGATRTWSVETRAVTDQTADFSSYYTRLQAYPKVWLVSWPIDESGSGRLSDESIMGLDPDSGRALWTKSPGPFDCAPTLASGALLCVDIEKAELEVLGPTTGEATSSALNGAQADFARSYDGDVVFSNQEPSGSEIVETIERARLDGTVVWKKSQTCDGYTGGSGMTFATPDEQNALELEYTKTPKNGASLEGACLTGNIDLDTGTITPQDTGGDDGCLQSQPFDDADTIFVHGDPCSDQKQYPLIVPRGASTLSAITIKAYQSDALNVPTLWSADLPDARFSQGNDADAGFAHLGDYALMASAGHLYGIDTAHGPTWEQAGAFGSDSHVVLLPVDDTKPATPVLALDFDAKTITRLDPGFGATRVSTEPASLPACPKGQTPISFSIWAKGKGATLVCQGFTSVVTVVVIVGGSTSTSTTGRATPTGYHAEFSDGRVVDIGLGGWQTWVRQGSSTTAYTATRGWRLGEQKASAFPALSAQVQACPANTSPLSLSTWHGGWLLTCGTSGSVVTRFLYLDGSSRGSGGSMTTQSGQSCGADTAGRQVCVSASPAVVSFAAKGGEPTQHSVAANYVSGSGFGGAGQGTGAYGLTTPKADAASQVAYLAGILQQSQAARSSVKVVVQNILKCSSGQSDVQTAQSVAAARTTELAALNTAPVDAVPGGADLVSSLRGVLQDSLTADQAYVTAAGQVSSGQCDAGRATYRAQGALLVQVTNEKAAFTAAWNGRIAATYGTATYTQDDI